MVQYGSLHVRQGHVHRVQCVVHVCSTVWRKHQRLGEHVLHLNLTANNVRGIECIGTLANVGLWTQRVGRIHSSPTRRHGRIRYVTCYC